MLLGNNVHSEPEQLGQHYSYAGRHVKPRCSPGRVVILPQQSCVTSCPIQAPQERPDSSGFPKCRQSSQREQKSPQKPESLLWKWSGINALRRRQSGANVRLKVWEVLIVKAMSSSAWQQQLSDRLAREKWACTLVHWLMKMLAALVLCYRDTLIVFCCSNMHGIKSTM